MGSCYAPKSGSMIGNCAGENIRPACEVVRILGFESLSWIFAVIGVYVSVLGTVSGVILV